MKSINKFILEKLEPVNESFQSSIVEQWKAQIGKLYGWRSMMRKYKWNEVTDNDLVWHDQAEAKKLAYKRNETYTLFWVDANDQIIGYSTGNFTWSVFDYRYYKMKSIMPMVRDSKGAYTLDDKFATKELHRVRQEAKRNATALMDNERIKQDNLDRYAKIIKDNKMKSGEMYTSIKSKFDQVTERYKQLFEEVGSASEENFAMKMKELKKVSQAYTIVIEKLSATIDSYEREKSGSPWSGIMMYMGELETAINRYNSLFSTE